VPIFREHVNVVCAETNHYRQLARLQVNKGDCVLEIGSDLGACTSILASSVGTQIDGSAPEGTIDVPIGAAVGIDKSEQSVNEARKRFPDIPFHCLDVLLSPPGTLLSCLVPDRSGFDVVFIDINGNRMMKAVLKVIEIVKNELRPRLIVIKSKEMARVFTAEHHHSATYELDSRKKPLKKHHQGPTEEAQSTKGI
jgi:predicted O-methyltransferase YrrM